MNYPEMNPVSSSHIDSIGYDEPNEEVYIRFLDGSMYVYRGVPAFEFQNLHEAPSCGTYLNRNFKNVYPYERIE